MDKLSASLEDYLEIIYNCNWLKTQIRAVDISKQLKISRASVTEALKKLAEKGYINYERYEAISLTDKGEEIAKNISTKHKLLQSFFEQVLNLTKDEASYNACKIEHIITDNAFEKISEYMNNR